MAACCPPFTIPQPHPNPNMNWDEKFILALGCGRLLHDILLMGTWMIYEILQPSTWTPYRSSFHCSNWWCFLFRAQLHSVLKRNIYIYIYITCYICIYIWEKESKRERERVIYQTSVNIVSMHFQRMLFSQHVNTIQMWTDAHNVLTISGAYLWNMMVHPSSLHKLIPETARKLRVLPDKRA